MDFVEYKGLQAKEEIVILKSRLISMDMICLFVLIMLPSF